MNQKGEALYNIATYKVFLEHHSDQADDLFSHICLENKPAEADIQYLHKIIDSQPNELMTQRWLAAVDAGLATTDQSEIWGDSWTDEEKERFRTSLSKIQKEVFWKSIEMAGSDNSVKDFRSKIDDAISKINNKPL